MKDPKKQGVRFGLGKARPGKSYINLGKVVNIAETWEQLCARLAKVHRTPETFAEFLKLPRQGIGGQDALKSSAGFWIGCPCQNESRQYANLLPRSILAFDLDTLTPEGLEWITEGNHPLKNYTWVAHTTRKHTNEAPRLRLVILLSKSVKTELYEAVARIVANWIDKGLRWTDAVSFKPTQLMYLPTASSDNPFEFFESLGDKVLDPQKVFEVYQEKTGLDPYDARNWPRKADEDAIHIRALKAEDPWEKADLIGAFCRAYPIERLIAEHLSEFYEPGDANSTDVRYSAIGSSTSNGLVIYEEGRFATSNHGTDPIAGKSVNAWDMARICLYGDMDDPNGDYPSPSKAPSYKAMAAFARNLKDVQEEMLDRQLNVDEAFDEEEDEDEAEAEKGDEEFFDGGETEDPHADLDDDDRAMLGLPSKRTDDAVVPVADKPPADWKLHLVKDDKLQIENNLPNVLSIMRFDPRWFGKVRYNELSEKAVILKPIKFKDKPWANITVHDERNGDPVQDHHRLVFRAVMESGQGVGPGKGGYGFSSVSQVNLSDGIDGASRYHPFHPVKAFLGAKPKWDGVRRLAHALQTHLGVEDSLFVQEAFRLMMIAAVARTFEPGMKFDHLLLIQGKQGAGKSTFVKMLGKTEWHREFDIGFDDPQKIVEKTIGAVIVEMPEIAGFKRSDHEEFKHFMSSASTVVRMAYGRESKVFPRRFVCFGTTNDETPLKDMTGNRRIWFVRSTNAEESGIADLARLQADVDMYWHEAYHDYLAMRAAQPHGDLPLFLSPAARKLSAESNTAATKETEFSIMADQIEAWANMPITKAEALNRDTAEPHQDDDEMVTRSRFNPMDAWTEALQMRPEVWAREAWKVFAALEVLKDRWSYHPTKQRLDGVRCRWVYRKSASLEEGRQGHLEAPEEDDFDILG